MPFAAFDTEGRRVQPCFNLLIAELPSHRADLQLNPTAGKTFTAVPRLTTDVAKPGGRRSYLHRKGKSTLVLRAAHPPPAES